MAETKSINVDSLGAFFSYEIPSSTWEKQFVETLFTTNQIPTEYWPKLPNDGLAFGRTMRIMIDRGSNPFPRREKRAVNDPRPATVRNPLDIGHTVVFTKMEKSLQPTFRINRGSRSDAKEVMEYMNTVVWTPTGLEFATDYLKNEISAEYDNQRTYGEQDIRKSIVKLIRDCSPLPLKGYTALFFPSEFMIKVAAISNILDGLGCSVVRLDIAVTPASRENLIKQFMASIKADLDETERDLMERINSSLETKESTWERRTSSLEETRARINYFSTLLNCASDKLLERLDKLHNKIRQAMVDGVVVEEQKQEVISSFDNLSI